MSFKPLNPLNFSELGFTLKCHRIYTDIAMALQCKAEPTRINRKSKDKKT